MTQTETRYYITCPTCGPAQDVHQFCGWTTYRGQTGYLAGCKGCNQFVIIVGKPRSIATPRLDSRRSVRPCNGVCINGKTSCDCKCRGRCHGAGTCYCGTPVAA